ncbi:hypothetical protein Btru_058154 [Bulinus truncatus]|nr:hypothetical protein Btru_058154 [Bulinus truncatus]
MSQEERLSSKVVLFLLVGEVRVIGSVLTSLQGIPGMAIFTVLPPPHLQYGQWGWAVSPDGVKEGGVRSALVAMTGDCCPFTELHADEEDSIIQATDEEDSIIQATDEEDSIIQAIDEEDRIIQATDEEDSIIQATDEEDSIRQATEHVITVRTVWQRAFYAPKQPCL